MEIIKSYCYGHEEKIGLETKIECHWCKTEINIDSSIIATVHIRSGSAIVLCPECGEAMFTADLSKISLRTKPLSLYSHSEYDFYGESLSHYESLLGHLEFKAKEVQRLIAKIKNVREKVKKTRSAKDAADK